MFSMEQTCLVEIRTICWTQCTAWWIYPESDTLQVFGLLLIKSKRKGFEETFTEETKKRKQWWLIKWPDKSKPWPGFQSLARALWNKSLQDRCWAGLLALVLVCNLSWCAISCVIAFTWCLAVRAKSLTLYILIISHVSPTTTGHPKSLNVEFCTLHLYTQSNE